MEVADLSLRKVATRWRNLNEGRRDAADRLVLTNHGWFIVTLFSPLISFPLTLPTAAIKGFSSPWWLSRLISRGIDSPQTCPDCLPVQFFLEFRQRILFSRGKCRAFAPFKPWNILLKGIFQFRNAILSCNRFNRFFVFIYLFVRFDQRGYFWDAILGYKRNKGIARFIVCKTI